MNTVYSNLDVWSADTSTCWAAHPFICCL